MKQKFVRYSYKYINDHQYLKDRSGFDFFIVFVDFELKKWINIKAEESLHNLKKSLNNYYLENEQRNKELKIVGLSGTGAFSYTGYSHSVVHVLVQKM